MCMDQVGGDSDGKCGAYDNAAGNGYRGDHPRRACRDTAPAAICFLFLQKTSSVRADFTHST